jgi:hypothetical protein
MIKDFSGLSSAADRPHLRGGRDLDNTFLIGQFAHDQGMSVAETTQLLALIQNVSDRHVAKLRTQHPGIDIPNVKLHKAGRRLMEQVTKDSRGLFKSEVRRTFLNPLWIGQAASAARPNLEERVNIKNLLAEILLTVNEVSNFKTHFERMENADCGRIWGPFHSGDLMLRLQRLVGAKHGGTFVPCCYGLYWDKAQMNKSASRTRIPLSIFFVNMAGTDFRLYFLGYVPDELRYTDDELHVLMWKQGIQAMSHREHLITNMRNKQMLEYITWAVEDLTIRQDVGCKVQVGMDLPGQGASIVTRLVFFPVALCFDTMESVYSTMISYQSNELSCRVCMATLYETRCFFPLPDLNMRDSGFEERLLLQCSSIRTKHWQRCMERFRQKLTVQRMTPVESGIIQQAKEHGHPEKAGPNPLFNLFRATTCAGNSALHACLQSKTPFACANARFWLLHVIF